jgi:hypothetical protein
VFAREIVPVIPGLPLSDLVRATGLTHGYLSKVRRGEKEPHPRHWPALHSLAQRANSEQRPTSSSAQPRTDDKAHSRVPRLGRPSQVFLEGD